MMLALEKICRIRAAQGGFEISPISINSSAVVSVQPASVHWGPSSAYTEIAYTSGSSTEKIIVIGEYSEIVRKMGPTRGLLNG